MLLFVWLEKKHSNKVLTELCEGRFAGYLKIQIHVPWPSYHNNTFVLCFLVAALVVSHCHSLQQQQEKTTKA
jgi:hypothetical protein